MRDVVLLVGCGVDSVVGVDEGYLVPVVPMSVPMRWGLV